MGNASPESPFTLYESYAITRLSLCFFNLFLDNDGYMSWGIIGLSWPLESQLDRRNNVLHCSSEFIDANLIFPTTQCNLVVCNYVNQQTETHFWPISRILCWTTHQSPCDPCPDLDVTLHFCLLSASVAAVSLNFKQMTIDLRVPLSAVLRATAIRLLAHKSLAIPFNLARLWDLIFVNWNVWNMGINICYNENSMSFSSVEIASLCIVWLLLKVQFLIWNPKNSPKRQELMMTSKRTKITDNHAINLSFSCRRTKADSRKIKRRGVTVIYLIWNKLGESLSLNKGPCQTDIVPIYPYHPPIKCEPIA